MINNMETTDYVSYPLALALKKAGFDEECQEFYTPKGDLGSAIEADDFNSIGAQYQGEWFISAPTLAVAQKWLREKCGIHIDVCIYSDYSTDADGEVCDKWDFWGFDLYVVVGGEKLTDDDGEYDSYEAALSAGITAALELIEEKGE